MAENVLRIQDLTVAYRSGKRILPAVRDFSLEIEAGQVYGLVGESGSGKSTLALAVMGYLGEGGEVLAGRIKFEGRDLLALDPEKMRAVWGKQIALVPQDPYASLNPSMRIGEQVAESLRQHLGLEAGEARDAALEMLEAVRLPDPARIAQSYPHQISGGMQQRALIAMALAVQPSLLVLDEPTTSLDVTTEAAILDLLCELIKQRGTSALYVTHNLGVVAGLTDRVAVLYASELVEDAPTGELYARPLHPYTHGLLDSVPRLGQHKNERPLQGIAGQIPALGEMPKGCVFAERCPLAIDLCFDMRPTLDVPMEWRRVRCHRWPEILAGEVSAQGEAPKVTSGKEIEATPVLDVQDLKVHFPLRRGLGEMLAGGAPKAVKAVDGVSVDVKAGRTLGIVGESGSGKTSLARAAIGLATPCEGEIELLGVRLPPKLRERDRDTLRHLQMAFQNPEEALNPYLSVGETLRRPFMTLQGLSRTEADERAAGLLTAVKLPEAYARRSPGQLSGGEKQRVAIARAFAVSPELFIADEPVSSLDVSVQASILNLLNDLQDEHGTAMVFIGHDIAVVTYLADEVAVMYLGQVMERAGAGELFNPPYHPYTEALLSAVPPPDPSTKREHIRLEGEVPSAVDTPTGCPFHTRCPRFLGDICVDEKPPWQETAEGKQIYCHIPVEELAARQKRVVVWEE